MRCNFHNYFLIYKLLDVSGCVLFVIFKVETKYCVYKYCKPSSKLAVQV